MLFLIISILCLIAAYCLPWWVCAPIVIIAAFFLAKDLKHAFWSGFGAVFTIWTLLALIKTIPNDYVLATRVADIFHLPHWLLLLLLTDLIGGTLGGIAAVSGIQLRKLNIQIHRR